MKRFLSTLTIALLALTANAQSTSFEKAMKAFEAEYPLSTITFSQETVQFINLFDIEMKDAVKNLIEGIESMKFSMSKTTEAKMLTSAAEAFTNAGYEDFDISKWTSRTDVKLFVQHNLTAVTEAHVVTLRGRVAVVSLFGKFKLRDIRRLIEDE